MQFERNELLPQAPSITDTTTLSFGVRGGTRFRFRMRSRTVWRILCLVGLLAGDIGLFSPRSCGWWSEERSGEASEPASAAASFVTEHCLECHNQQTRTADLSLAMHSPTDITANSDTWEKVVRRLRVRQMPPADMPRPDEQAYRTVIASLEDILDRAAALNPRPGRTETFRRLTRTEYHNAVRDLLAVEMDVSSMLPPDESSHGFDNVTVSDLSPTLLSRYISAAQKISRLAVGSPMSSPDGFTIRLPPDLTQEGPVEGLPVGTRGGALIPCTFPRDGKYEIQIRLMRDRNEEVEGLYGEHHLEVLLDGARKALFTVRPPPGRKDFSGVDAGLKVRIPITGGRHSLAVTFLKGSSSLLETKRQPLNARFNMHRHPRTAPAVYQISVTGPFNSTGPGNSESRRRIFVCSPNSDDASDEDGQQDRCAEQILTQLMRRAYRRPVDSDDLITPMTVFRSARNDGGFEAGIEAAISAVLVSPHFLFRIEADPPDVMSGAAYQLDDFALASRLSFFLWSSIPDDELLDLAAQGKLRESAVLEQQTRRILSDQRSASLVENFAGQWLYLRNLDSITPDARLYPDFDENLRRAMRRETELLFEDIMRKDDSVLNLLRSDHTFLNERLAKHYGVPHVYGSRFRRVAPEAESHRGGLLRHGSILTVTSYATRTSPVIRGHWILKNLLGAAPPPPPANVPALSDNTVDAGLSVREQLEQHRASAACAGCHNLMDPPGFALENFDAVGRWRNVESGRPIDASAELWDGSKISGVTQLEQSLLEQSDVFVGTMVEKLLTYALGRGIENSDAAAVRRMVRQAEQQDFRFTAVIIGIVGSEPFQMRTAQ